MCNLSMLSWNIFCSALLNSISRLGRFFCLRFRFFFFLSQLGQQTFSGKFNRIGTIAFPPVIPLLRVPFFQNGNDFIQSIQASRPQAEITLFFVLHNSPFPAAWARRTAAISLTRSIVYTFACR